MITVLPAQAERIAKLATLGRGAIEISQDGSLLTINTGLSQITINAEGDVTRHVVTDDTQE